MPHCNYIGADCAHAVNALKCQTVPAVNCRERREQLLQKSEKSEPSDRSEKSERRGQP